MSKKEFNELMGAINSIKAEVAELRSEVDTLKSSSKKSSTSKTVSGKKSTPKKTASSKVSDLVLKFEPKAQGDNYHWGSYKAQRTKFVEAVTGKKDQWLPKEEYNKAAKPWVAYWGEYVKIENR